MRRKPVPVHQSIFLLLILCTLQLCWSLPNGVLPAGPLSIAYYETWTDDLVSDAGAMDLANMPGYINILVLSFLQPNCTYTAGQSTWQGTGLEFWNTPAVVKAAIALLKARRPNTRILVSVGGALYTQWAQLSTTCIKTIVEDLDLDGIDLDYEPQPVACNANSGAVRCNTDRQSVAVLSLLRKALPQGKYLVGAATWPGGVYGEGQFATSKPKDMFARGMNLAVAKSEVGQSLDFVSIMAYGFGNKTSTGFDWREAYRAHRAYWPTQAVVLGSMVPPEPGTANSRHSITVEEATERCMYAQAHAGAAPYGHMTYSLHSKSGCPGPQHILQAVCNAYNMGGCDEPLPYYTLPCNGPTPVPVCTGSSLHHCGDANGQCCASGMCCSKHGWCGTTADHCGPGCQAWAGVCS